MSETSQLTEKISEDLLDQKDLYQIIIMDGANSNRRYETSAKLASPYDFDLNRFVPNDEILTLPKFFDLAASVILDAQIREGIIADERVRLVENFNPYEMHQHGDEVITWQVIKRGPAQMNAKATGRPQRRPGFSYDLQLAADPNKVIVVDSMPIDHIIEFACWSKISNYANNRALWLERLFIEHAWAFSIKGTEKFFWQGRGADTFMEVSQQRLYKRPNRFFLRLREFYSRAYSEIKNFDFEVGLS
jgi:hypothetical protein